MNELYEKSLNKLELPAILAKLAEFAHSENAKDRCRQLLPLDDREEILLLQEQQAQLVATRLLSISTRRRWIRQPSITYSLNSMHDWGRQFEKVLS